MPRKTKDNLKEEKIEVKKEIKKIQNEKPVVKKTNTTIGKTVATKSKTVTKKKTPIKKDTKIKKSSKEKTTVKTKKTTKKQPSKKTNKSTKKFTQTVEYYDLPFTYNQTSVKVLAQTPTTLFIYWDMSNEDKEKYISEYGKDFFLNTKPVLIIKNDTLNYCFEVEINDYSNNWYLHVKDSNCKYTIELGRRPLNYEINIPNNYIYVSSSNIIESPNDHILFDNLGDTVFFRDIKTNITTQKQISSLSHIRNIGKIYNIYELYKEMYKNELKENELEINFDSSSSSSAAHS